MPSKLLSLLSRFRCNIARKFLGMSSGLWIRRISAAGSRRLLTVERLGSRPPISRLSRGRISGSVRAPIPTLLARASTSGVVLLEDAELEVDPAINSLSAWSATLRLCIVGCNCVTPIEFGGDRRSVRRRGKAEMLFRFCRAIRELSSTLNRTAETDSFRGWRLCSLASESTSMYVFLSGFVCATNPKC